MPEAISPLRNQPPTQLQRMAVSCATVLGIGLLRPGPGTWASIVAGVAALIIILCVPPDFISFTLIVAAITASALCLVSAPAAVRHFSSGDPGPVVIDEVAGTWLTIALVPASTLAVSPIAGVILSVLLFRVFDIAKPWPVSWFERLPGAFGIIADDLAAGVFAGILAAALLH
jgi:phosphatidylglycerophosphatase A